MLSTIGTLASSNKKLKLIDTGLEDGYSAVFSSAQQPNSVYWAHIINNPFIIEKQQGMENLRQIGGWTPLIDFTKYRKVEIEFTSSITAYSSLSFHRFNLSYGTKTPNVVTQSETSTNYILNSSLDGAAVLSVNTTVDISSINGSYYLYFDWILPMDVLANVVIKKIVFR